MATTTLHISLPEELKGFVHERVAEEAFSNPSDYVRSLIRADRQRHRRAQLEASLLDGLASGAPEPLDDAEWARIEADAVERAADRGA